MRADDEAHWSELMRRAQAGDSPAYARLLAEVGDAIAAYLYRRFGRVEFSEDCVQECLLSLHKARHTFNPERPFRPWLFAIVRHRVVDMLRRQRTYARLSGVSLDEANTADLYADDAGEQQLRSISAGSVLAALPPNQREALTLTKLMGLSIAEAAGQLGISQAAMKVRVHRAARAAARMLEGEP